MRRPASIAFVVITALACATLVYCLHTGWREAAAAAKFIASTGFLATAVSAGALRHGFGRVIFAGLLLSMAGDMFLVGQTQHFFLFGLASFLLAHVAYTTAFILHGQDRRHALLAALPITVIAVLVLAWLEPHLEPPLELPVKVYVAAISLMVITAFGAHGAGAARLVVIGAVLFFVSDIAVAMQRIVAPGFPAYLWGLPLYYAGQLCLALGSSHSSSQ
ncbi:MAG: lysoplasmalogenase [Woeseiaceae bacterium]|nr:lysoplasmalogenase [Woeseiaceae bacterium]